MDFDVSAEFRMSGVKVMISRYRVTRNLIDVWSVRSRQMQLLQFPPAVHFAILMLDIVTASFAS